MAEVTSVAAFVDRIDRIGKAATRPNRVATRDAAETFAEVVDAQGDRSGATSWSGARRPRYAVRQRNAAGDMLIKPRNLGAVVALNSGTKPHFVGARGNRRARSVRNTAVSAARSMGLVTRASRVRGGRGGVLKLPGPVYSPYARPSGTSGFGFVTKAKKKAPDAAAKVWFLAKRREVRSV